MSTLSPPAEPAPATSSAEVEFAVVDGLTVVTKWRSGTPFKLLVPRQRDRSAWVIGSNFGGGMLAGDAIDLSIRSGAGSRGLFGTQASTKIYRSPAGATARQTLSATVEANALLAVLPDPVACFADARYEQHQRFDLHAGASLVLLDWFTSGRIARGERWDMERYRSVNDVFVDDRRVVHDAVLLDREDGPLEATFRTGRFNCLASVFLFGPLVQDAIPSLIASVRGRKLDRQPDLLVTISPLTAQHAQPTPGQSAAPRISSTFENIRRGAALYAGTNVSHGAILRVAGVSVEAVKSQLIERLGFVSELLGIDPWSRKW